MEAHPYVLRLNRLRPFNLVGYVQKVSSGFVTADGPLCTVGDICEIECQKGTNGASVEPVLAEVAGVEDNRTILIPLVQTATILPDARVVARPTSNHAPVGDEFAGRLINSMAMPLDGGPEIYTDHTLPVSGNVMLPMQRAQPSQILQTGVRAIDGMLTIGVGQRLGIFAASGVGKTTLLKQLAEQIECDRCVICLVGERGREVESMWRELSSKKNADKYSCVAATSDKSAALRARAVYQAICLAEYWRGQGEDVLLLVDSVTRFAMALREIGLAAGAPPTLRAYTPNVFDALPRLVERCGASKQGGSITAVMTILSETDEVDDPIVEVMKSLLDGHIILSRQLAELGHFPAIDVPRSISREATNLMDKAHAKAAQNATSMLSAYDEAKVMIESGIYKKGGNELIDAAIRNKEKLSEFLKQNAADNSGFGSTLEALQAIDRQGG